ncbi:MAG: O-antigen ligase family protein, partial [Candidatus Falkowbacteria bacterium]
IIGGLFINKDKNFIKYNPAFQVIREVDFQKNTFQTRLISWRAALKDFKEHPILGVGHGNYAVIFDKYFEPTFYDYTRSETYFDRAHNNIIDIGSTSGALGLLTYLSIFFAVAGYLIRAYRKDRITIHEFILLSSLIIAYFVQNLAVFDSFTTYLSLMITLGFIYFLVNKENDSKGVSRYAHAGDKEFRNIDLFIFLILIIAMSMVLFKYNIRPIQMLRGVIYGQIAFGQEGYLEKGFEIYKKGLSYNTPLDRDGRDSLTRVIISDFPLNKVGYEKAEEMLEYTIDMANKNIEYNPQDALMHTDLSQLYGVAADFYNGKDEEKFIYYSDKSLEEINKAIEISPMRIPVYFVKSYFYSVRYEKDKAIETIEYATTLNEKYYDSFCHLARYYFMDKQNFKGFENMDKCLDLGGQDLLVSEGYVRNMIEYYTDKDDTYKLIKLYDRLTKIKPIEPKPWLRLASLYGKVGDMENLLIVSEKAVKIDPTLRDNMDAIIQITKDNAWAEVEKEAEGKVESEE